MLLVWVIFLCFWLRVESVPQLRCDVDKGNIYLQITGMKEYLEDTNSSATLQDLAVLMKDSESNQTKTIKEFPNFQVDENTLSLLLGNLLNPQVNWQFQVTSRNNTMLNFQPLAKIHFSNHVRNDSIDTWKDGFTVNAIEDCMENTDTDFIVKSNCSTLHVLLAEKVYPKVIYMEGFEVDGKKFSFHNQKGTKCINYLCRYTGELLTPNKYHKVCAYVEKDKRRQRICEQVYADCPNLVNESKCKPGKVFSVPAIALTVLLLVSLIANIIFIVFIVKRRSVTKESNYASVANPPTPECCECWKKEPNYDTIKTYNTIDSYATADNPQTSRSISHDSSPSQCEEAILMEGDTGRKKPEYQTIEVLRNE